MGAAAAKSQNHALSDRLFVAINQNDLQKASNITTYNVCKASLRKRSRYKDIRYLRMDGSTVCTEKWTRINS
jgi:hypothetical protein